MNIYEFTVDYISNLPVLKAWPESEIMLDHAASKQPRDWQLPLLVCEIGGGKARTICPCLRIGGLRIDWNPFD